MELITWSEAKQKGLKRYFTGELCQKGHTVERYVGTRHCVECDRLRLEAKRQEKEFKANELLRLKRYNRTVRQERRKERYSTDSIFKEAELTRLKEWYKNGGKEVKKAINRAYRARKINAANETINKIMTDIFCKECPKGYEVDHIIPLSKGGIHDISNLQYLTKSKNAQKKDKHYLEMGWSIVCIPCESML